MYSKKSVIIHNAVFTALCLGIDIKNAVERELKINKIPNDSESKIIMNREIARAERLLDEE